MDKLRQFVSGRLYHFLFALFILIYLYRLADVCTTYNRYHKVLNEDAFGYYTILPALLKYHDPDFRFLDTSIKKLPEYRDYIPPVVNHAPNGRPVSKYYSGVALLQLPFYLAGDVVARVKGEHRGYENTYHFAILLSVVFYLSLAFFHVFKILCRLGITPLTALGILPLILFGSNLYAYTTFDMAYSHIYSFFAMVFFIRFLLDIKDRPTKTNAILCGLFYGLILMIRPLNGIAILFVPVIFNGKEFLSFFTAPKIHLTLLSCVSTFLVISLQSLLWFWQTGLFYVYPYGTEKLNLQNPRMIELVFGFDSGWAIYSPLPFLILLSALLLLVWQKRFRQFIWASLCSLSILYLLSCWYYLHYGCTIGCRPITEFYGPFFILFAAASVSLFRKTWFKLIFFSLSYLLLGYNQLIHYQFYENIMNWCQMDKEKFRMVFLQTHPAYKYSTYPFWDFSGYGSGKEINEIDIRKTIFIDAGKPVDTLSLALPAMALNDSSLLLTLSLNCKMQDALNGSFVKIYISDGGQYVDLQHFLLRRKVNQVDQFQQVDYELLITKPLTSARMEFSLESADAVSTTTELQIINARFKRVHP
jgi:hypothetical protein